MRDSQCIIPFDSNRAQESTGDIVLVSSTSLGVSPQVRFVLLALGDPVDYGWF
jgi:hypothetical protein